MRFAYFALGNGVRGEGFGPRRVPEQGCRINARRRTDVLYGKSALRQRSGLVKDHGVTAGKRFHPIIVKNAAYGPSNAVSIIPPQR